MLMIESLLRLSAWKVFLAEEREGFATIQRLEQAALHCGPLIWCMYQVNHSGRAGMPLSVGFV